MRKSNEKAHLMSVLEENEKNKVIAAQNLQKVREEDIKACEEYSKILDKQENDRANYFKMREKKQNECMSRMVENVIKGQNEKDKKELENILRYQDEKNKRDEEEENRRKLRVKMNKKDMRSFLNGQMSDKKKLAEFEKTLDAKQLKIFQDDYETYLINEKYNNQKLKNKNLTYQDFLKQQIEERKAQNIVKMNDNEYLLNKNLLEDIKSPEYTK